MIDAPLLWGAEYTALPSDPQTWLWHGLIPYGGLVCLAADPKLGKSFLALQIAAAVSHQATPEVLSVPIDHHGPVAYIQLDMPRTLFKDTYIHNNLVGRAGYNVEWVSFIDRIMPQVPRPMDIREQVGWFAEYLARVHPVLVIYDTLRELHPHDENDSTEMRNVMQALRQTTDAAILVTSHARKPQQGGTKHNAIHAVRGSTYIPGACDVVLHLEGDADDRDRIIHVAGRTDFEGPLYVHQTACGVFVRRLKPE